MPTPPTDDPRGRQPVGRASIGQAGRNVGRALAHRNYRLFFGGQLVSLVGTWMQSVAQAWLVYRLTKSTVLLGATGFASQIPVFLLAPLGGLVADRCRRHRVILATQTTMMVLAFALAALTLTDHIRVRYVFALAAAVGVANAFDIPARQSFITEMVGREDLMSAIALNSSMVNGARILGPLLAGVTVASVGEGWCFFINGASFLAVLAGLLLMRDLTPVRPTPSNASARAHIAEGFAYVTRTAPIRNVLLLLGLVSLMGVPYSTLMPAIADRVLGRGADGVGILLGATGAGALAGALTLGVQARTEGLDRWVSLAAIIFGVSLVAFSFSHTFWLSFAFLIPTGYGFMMQMAASNTLVQTRTPDTMRGRVMAVYSMMFMGMAPFGALLAGWTASHVGPLTTVRIGGVCTILGGVAFVTHAAKGVSRGAAA